MPSLPVKCERQYPNNVSLERQRQRQDLASSDKTASVHTLQWYLSPVATDASRIAQELMEK